jgi:hypothetical protein
VIKSGGSGTEIVRSAVCRRVSTSCIVKTGRGKTMTPGQVPFQEEQAQQPIDAAFSSRSQPDFLREFLQILL